MKAKLTFDFDADNDDRIHFESAINGHKWKSSMWELDQWLRSKIKYAPDQMSDEELNAYESTRSKLHEILGEETLNLE